MLHKKLKKMEQRGNYVTVKRWGARRKTAQALAQRARLILACAQGYSNNNVSAQVGLGSQSLGKWHRRFLDKRLDRLLDEQRPGAPRKITDADVEPVITLTLETTPADATHWSTRFMAKRSGLSHSAVSRIWRAFALEPHPTKTFKLSKDPLFIEKVRDVVGLYLKPPDKALVLCVNEESGIQALDRTAPLLSMRPGQIERRTHDYTRNGTSDLFAALEVATGRVIARCQRRHRSVDFRRFLEAIDASVPAELDVHMILDKSAIHKTALIHRWLAQRPRYHVHFTPTSSSWLNLVERWSELLTEKQLSRGVHRCTRELEETIARYVESTKARAKPFVWTKSADDILASLSRFCMRTYNSGHQPPSVEVSQSPMCWPVVCKAGRLTTALFQVLRQELGFSEQATRLPIPEDVMRRLA